MLTIKAEIKKGELKANGTYNVKIRFTLNRKVKRLSSSLFVSPKDLTKSGDFKKTTKIYKEIENLVQGYKNKCNEMQVDYLMGASCIRNSYCKGVVVTFDFHKFAKEIAYTDTVVDVWGNEHKIDDIELILTTSMLKLWDSYTSIDDYLQKCDKNHKNACKNVIL